MDSSLQLDVLERLAREPARGQSARILVLAALPAYLERWMIAAK